MTEQDEAYQAAREWLRECAINHLDGGVRSLAALLRSREADLRAKLDAAEARAARLASSRPLLLAARQVLHCTHSNCRDYGCCRHDPAAVDPSTGAMLPLTPCKAFGLVAEIDAALAEPAVPDDAKEG